MLLQTVVLRHTIWQVAFYTTRHNNWPRVKRTSVIAMEDGTKLIVSGSYRRFGLLKQDQERWKLLYYERRALACAAIASLPRGGQRLYF